MSSIDNIGELVVRFDSPEVEAVASSLGTDGEGRSEVATKNRWRFILTDRNDVRKLFIAADDSGIGHVDLAPQEVGQKGEHLVCAGKINGYDDVYVGDWGSTGFRTDGRYGRDCREGVDVYALEPLIVAKINEWRDRVKKAAQD